MSDLEDGELSEGEIQDEEMPVPSTSPKLLAPPPPLPNLASLSPLARNSQPQPSMVDYGDVDFRRNDKYGRSDGYYDGPPPNQPQQDILQMHNRPPPSFQNKTDVDMRKRAHPSPPLSMDDSKRVRPSFTPHPPPPAFMNNGGAPRMPGVGGPLGPFQPTRRRFLCKFFREGHCRDADNCTFSHSAGDANRAPELCKWYADSFCRKGAHCQYLHAEWPCLMFAKGTCEKKPCKYSHEPLDAYTRPIVDRFLTDEKLAAERAKKAAAAKPLPPRQPRRVLLHLPLSQRGEMQICEFAKALQYQRLIFVEDALATQQAQQLALQHQQQAAAAAAMNVTKQLAGPGGVMPSADACFTPIAPRPTGLLATPNVPPIVGEEIFAQQPPAGHVEMSAYRQPVEPNFVNNVIPPLFEAKPAVHDGRLGHELRHPERQPHELPADVAADKDEEKKEKPPTFNLQEMLARIKAQVPPSRQKAQEEAKKIDESPASPPPPSSTNGGRSSRAIPSAKAIKWRLRAVYVPHAPNTNIAQCLLDSALTDLRLRSDPRIKKALSEQFNATTSALTTSLPQQQQKVSADAQQQQQRAGVRDPRLARRQAQQQNESAEKSTPTSSAVPASGGGWMPSFSSPITTSTTAPPTNSSPSATTQPPPSLFAPIDPRLARRNKKQTPTDPRWKPALGVRDS